jgi:hypothetical protein
MNTQERMMEAAKLRLRFQMNNRLRLESLAALSRVFREHQEPVADDLLASLVFAVPEELLGEMDTTGIRGPQVMEAGKPKVYLEGKPGPNPIPPGGKPKGDDPGKPGPNPVPPAGKPKWGDPGKPGPNPTPPGGKPKGNDPGKPGPNPVPPGGKPKWGDTGKPGSNPTPPAGKPK